MNVYFVNDCDGLVIGHEELVDSVPRVDDTIVLPVKGQGAVWKVMSCVWDIPIKAVHIRLKLLP
jgi:hypothetical protein